AVPPEKLFQQTALAKLPAGGQLGLDQLVQKNQSKSGPGRRQQSDQVDQLPIAASCLDAGALLLQQVPLGGFQLAEIVRVRHDDSSRLAAVRKPLHSRGAGGRGGHPTHCSTPRPGTKPVGAENELAESPDFRLQRGRRPFQLITTSLSRRTRLVVPSEPRTQRSGGSGSDGVASSAALRARLGRK